MSTAIHKVTSSRQSMALESIWGVYHADGGLIGELKYVAGALFKGQHCSLCDITHKIAWEKSDMKKLRNEADVPFHLVHLNERPDDLISYTNGKTPVLVAKTDSGFITIASDDELKDCKGSVQALSLLITEKLENIVS